MAPIETQSASEEAQASSVPVDNQACTAIAVDEEEKTAPPAELPHEVAVEIAYVDPSDGKLHTCDVFADPRDWQFSWYKARLLISSDFVNLLGEAAAARQVRTEAYHVTLEKIRLGYACDLDRLRNVIFNAMPPKMTSAASVEGGEDTALQEVCPVHFFTTDRYLDCLEIEHTQNAIQMAERDIRADIKDMEAKVKEFGGGSWRQILCHIMKQGNIMPLPLNEIFLKHFKPGEEERRKLSNELTNGLCDKFDELEITVRRMDAELADEHRRSQSIDVMSGKQHKRIEELREELVNIRDKLKIRPEQEYLGGIVRKTVTRQEEVIPVFEEVKAPDVGPLFAELLMQWEAKLKRIREEINRLKKIYNEWAARLREPDETEALTKLWREWTEKVERLRLKLKNLLDKRDRMRAKLDDLLQDLEASKNMEVELAAEVEALPPPDPNRMLAAQMRRQIKRLEASSRQLLKKIADLQQRIASLKYELRKLYKKLGWDLDFSEDEGEEINEKPYWERRKLAMGGTDPVLGSNGKLKYANKDFNPRDFVFAEREYKSKRANTRMVKMRNEVRSKLHSQMAAKKLTVADDISKSGAKEGDVQASLESTQPFSSVEMDSTMQSMSSALQRLSISREDLGLLPAWAHDPREREWRCTQLVQLQDLTTVLTGKLLRSAGDMVDALLAPVADEARALEDGLREKLQGALEELHNCASAPPTLGEENGEDGALASACAAVRVLMEEAVAAGAAPSIAEHVADFEGLERRLRDVRASESRLRQEMSVLQGRAGDAFGGLRISRKARAASALASSASVAPSRPCSAVGRLSPAATTGGFFGSSSASASPARSSAFAPAFSASPQRASSLGSVTDDYEQSFWDSASPRSLEEARGQLAPQSVASRRQHLRKGGCGRDVDLGFRPDGAGEEPLENWSLFKVSKNLDSTQLGNTGTSFQSGTSSLGRQKQLIMESSKGNGSTQDFQEYVAQLRTGSAQQASSPNLLASKPQDTSPNKDRMRQTSLPQLVTPSKGTDAKGTNSPEKRRLRLQFCKSSTSRGFKTWGYA